MAEGIVHQHLKEIGLKWIKTKVTDLVCPEVDFKNIYSIADVVGVNFKRQEIRVIEVKATKKDFLRDKKLFNKETSYYYHSHYCYIMSPQNIINKDEVPYGYGLLWVNDKDEVEVVKNPIKNKSRLKTLFQTTLKKTVKQLTNTFLYKEENRFNYDETKNKFSRNSIIKMISYKCLFCKQKSKDLINIQNTKYLDCSFCKEKNELDKISYNVITGFNSNFIKKINSLLNQEKR